MYKLVIDAGHGINTIGKRCLKSIDKNETREWSLNSRIATKLQNILNHYNNIEILRVDDITGKTDVDLNARPKKANNYNADFYLSIHHNAGINGGNGGGTEVYTYLSVDNTTISWQNDIYNEFICLTGLKGNRSSGVKKADFCVLRETKMPAVLIECGFMDSSIDTPIILSEDFANKSAQALANVIIKKWNLSAKQQSPNPQPQEKNNVIYQSYDTVSKKWLPNIINNSDYSGIFGRKISCVFAHLTTGNIIYAVHTIGGKWLPFVTNRNDYAGIYGKPIDGLMIKTDTGKTIKYRVHIVGGNWLPYVTGCNANDSYNGYAGILNKSIDGIQIWFE